jgi:hypothetical protein
LFGNSPLPNAGWPQFKRGPPDDAVLAAMEED